jgi:protein unc-119
MTSNIELVNVPDDPEDLNVENYDKSLDEDPSKRMIKYHLGPDFLELKTVGLTMNFSIGPDAIKSLEMVERHYFRGKCIRDYGFKFGFVIPNSHNSWEFIYDLPDFTPEEKAEIIAAPWEVKSDSFFFTNGKLMLHNRAEYNYAPTM